MKKLRPIQKAYHFQGFLILPDVLFKERFSRDPHFRQSKIKLCGANFNKGIFWLADNLLRRAK